MQVKPPLLERRRSGKRSGNRRGGEAGRLVLPPTKVEATKNDRNRTEAVKLETNCTVSPWSWDHVKIEGGVLSGRNNYLQPEV